MKIKFEDKLGAHTVPPRAKENFRKMQKMAVYRRYLWKFSVQNRNREILLTPLDYKDFWKIREREIKQPSLF